MKRAWLVLLAVPHIMLCSSITIGEANLSFTTLDYPNAYLGSTNNGINSSGEIVGCAILCSYGFLYDGGAFKMIFADTITMPFGINGSGQIVGTSFPCGVIGCSGSFSGFLDSGGKFTTINVPGAANTWAQGINDSGQIVGFYGPDAGNEQGFLYSGGRFTTIDVPGAASTWVYGINDLGQIVGEFTDTGGHQHGFLYSGGVFTTIDVPGAEETQAYGINNRGQIVGEFYEPAGEFGFLDTGGSFAAIVPPGTLNNSSSYFETAANGINDSGQIVGFFFDASGENGYVATPVPEPSSAALAGSLIAFFAIAFRRRLTKRR